MINAALAPYRTGEHRFTVSGPPLVVKSRQALALSLAIHELATNALKYGALTVATGHVSLTWTSEDHEGEPKFVFVWRGLADRQFLNLSVWDLVRASFLGCCKTISEAPLKYPMDRPGSFAA